MKNEQVEGPGVWRVRAFDRNAAGHKPRSVTYAVSD
jgi:hypothetical protein